MFFHKAKLKRTLFPVLLTYFLDNFGLAIIYPIFTPLIIKTELSFLPLTTSHSARAILLGCLIASFPLAQFFGAPLIGQFSDRFGRKKAFCVTVLGTTLGYALTALSLHLHSLTGLFISRCFTGLFAGNLTLCLAALADLSPNNTSRTRNFSLVSAVGGMSFILAILFGGFLSDPTAFSHFNPSFPFWITALFSCINFFCILLLFHETHKGPRHPGVNPLQGINNLKLGIQNKTLRTLYSVNFLVMLSWIACMQFLPAFLLERFKFSLQDITLCLMLVGALWSLSNLLLNRTLAKRLYPGHILLGSSILLALLLLFTLMTHSATSFLLLFFPAVCFAALCWTNVLATLSLKTPSTIQGSVLGINQSMTSMAALLGPLLGGLLIAINPHAVYLFGGILTLTAFCILLSHKAHSPTS